MANNYDNTNRGIISPNTRKTDAKHADYNGKINVNGQDFYLNGWKKNGKNGPFLSLSVKPVGAASRPQGGNTGYAPQGAGQAPARGNYQQQAYAQPAHDTGFADEIPF